MDCRRGVHGFQSGDKRTPLQPPPILSSTRLEEHYQDYVFYAPAQTGAIPDPKQMDELAALVQEGFRRSDTGVRVSSHLPAAPPGQAVASQLVVLTRLNRAAAAVVEEEANAGQSSADVATWRLAPPVQCLSWRLPSALDGARPPTQPPTLALLLGP